MAIPAKPTITAPPNDLPTRGENETNFSNKINNLVAWYPSLTDNLNNSIDWMDTVFTAVEGEVVLAQQAVTDAEAQVVLAQQAVTDAEAQVTEAETIKDNVASTANFAGLWSDLTGSVAPPLSVYHSGQYWQLLVALADVTSVEPGTDVGTWIPIAETALDIGSITYSFDDLTASGLFVETGMSYLQSAYPELFGIIGIGEAPPITKIPDVSTLPNISPRGVGVSDNADYVAVAGASAVAPETILRVYSRSGDTLTALSDPDVNPSGAAFEVGVNGDGSLIALGLFSSPFFELYSRSGTTITKETNPATVPFDTVSGAGFDRNDAYLAVVSDNNSGVNTYVYSVSGSTLTLTDSFAGAAARSSLAWHPTEDYLVITGGSTAKIELYSNDSGVLTSEQIITDTDTVLCCAWSADGAYLVVGTSGGNVRLFSYSSGVLTEVSQTENPVTGGEVNGAGFTSDGKFVLLGLSVSPYVISYAVTDGVLVDSFTPTSAPTSAAIALVVSPDNEYAFVVSPDSPYLFQYKSDFPFDTATEFYVPDVDPLSPTQIGDWLPSVTGTAYVRAK